MGRLENHSEETTFITTKGMNSAVLKQPQILSLTGVMELLHIAGILFYVFLGWVIFKLKTEEPKPIPKDKAYFYLGLVAFFWLVWLVARVR